MSVTTTANNGIVTGAGIKVGMSKDRFIAIYGYHDPTKTTSDGNINYCYRALKPEGARVFSDALELDFALTDNRITTIFFV